MSRCCAAVVLLLLCCSCVDAAVQWLLLWLLLLLLLLLSLLSLRPLSPLPMSECCDDDRGVVETCEERDIVPLLRQALGLR